MVCGHLAGSDKLCGSLALCLTAHRIVKCLLHSKVLLSPKFKDCSGLLSRVTGRGTTSRVTLELECEEVLPGRYLYVHPQNGHSG